MLVKEYDDAQRILNEERLRLEQPRFDDEERWRDEGRRDLLREAEENRRECKEEREAGDQLDLDKFKLMMDMLSQKNLE